MEAAENRRTLYAFEAAGPKQLKYLGSPRTVEERRGRAPGDDGAMRSVLQFRLRFPPGHGRRFAMTPEPTSEPRRRNGRAAAQRPPARRARRFDPTRSPAPREYSSERLEPEETLALQEKANQGHHSPLTQLQDRLLDAGWEEVEEIPAAIDLRATSPNGERVIFEAKTVSDSNETSQLRSGLAQLFKYRVAYGKPDDLLCVVVDREISLRRARLLDAFEVGVLVVTSNDWRSLNDWGSELLGV